jgi:hypothetical protein
MTASATVQPAWAPRSVRYAGENARRGMRANTVRDLAAVFAAHLEEPVHPPDSSSRVHAVRRGVDLLVEGDGVEVVSETEVAFRVEAPDAQPEAWRETCVRCLPAKLQSGEATLVRPDVVGAVLAELVDAGSRTKRNARPCREET